MTPWLTFFPALPTRLYHAGRAVISHLRSQNLEASTQNIKSAMHDVGFMQLFPVLINKTASASQSLSIFSAIRLEAREKRHQLRLVREHQAEQLGLLVSQGFKLPANPSPQDLKESVAQCVFLLDGVMKKPDQTDTLNVQDFKPADYSIQTVSTGLRSLIIDTLPAYSKQSLGKARQYGKPSVFVRYWMPALGAYLFSSSILSYVTSHKADIQQWINESIQTARDFGRNWVLEPLKSILDTVRHKEESLTLMGKDSLRTDLDSLERMVLDFSKEKYKVSDTDLADMASRVRQGDLSSVLKVYETEMKSPVKSALTGSLVQALLIQLQKTKVDVELAMSGIDKLLQSQELTFAFIGVTPSLLILWGLTRWIASRTSKRRGVRGDKALTPVRETLQEIDRLLGSSTEEELSYKEQGLLMCHIHLVRSYASNLPLVRSSRRQLLQDLRSLEDPDQSLAQKRRTIERIWRWTNGILRT